MAPSSRILRLAAIGALTWLVLNVNSNSLHQLYRDRLGAAFLVRRRRRIRRSRRRDIPLEATDTFSLTALAPELSPYLIINAALNVPGSKYANQRGRNADFFMFSRKYIGSEATQYVETDLAEKAVDGLNIGTAMAISGAAAAPNMGIASLRPLSPTIAIINLRLGRWVRNPGRVEAEAENARRNADKEAEDKAAAEKQGRKCEPGHEPWRSKLKAWWFSRPGPFIFSARLSSSPGRISAVQRVRISSS